MKKPSSPLVFVLGIRPDIIRAALIIKYLKRAADIPFVLIWSGQHYSNNLKTVFFREFGLPSPDIDLHCTGDTDAKICSQLIAKLYPVLQKLHPKAVCFLGDTNTTTGCVAALQLNIPIVHIEGCWRSYDWRMPEEKYRTIIDHVADVIYTYEKEYKKQGISEGLNPKNIIVFKNPIVDILNTFYTLQKQKLERKATKQFFSSRGIIRKSYYLMTCHRRENVEHKEPLSSIMHLVSKTNTPVYFPASYRTQRMIKTLHITPPQNLIITDPVGYQEMLILMTHATAVFTDSGTVIEETCVLNIPAVQMRKSTERPQVYDVGSCVKFDPDQPALYTPEKVLKKLAYILKHPYWKHTLGDGHASERIASDLIKRYRTNNFDGHNPKNSHLPTSRSYCEDGIFISHET
ncbi:MAG: UDP-N-acetyl glucosamine 2-epimerase [Candidatus Gottesmanbacteria bacterium]